MIRRDITKELTESATEYPVVTVFGPRQSGKTTLVKLTLLSFSLPELRNYKAQWDAYELIVKGFFPRPHEENLTQGRFYNGYIQTYVERDVRSLIAASGLIYISTGTPMETKWI
jgi:hypothetical protein